MPRLAFLTHGDHAALDAAIDACLARTERTLYTRWRGYQFPRARPLQQPLTDTSSPVSYTHLTLPTNREV